MEKIKDINSQLNLNTKINVIVAKGNYKGLYDSRVEDIAKNSISITIPTEKGIPFPIMGGTDIEVTFVTEKGRFSFTSKVIARITDTIPLLQIEKPEYLFRAELRKYFRVETRLKIRVGVVKYMPTQSGHELLFTYYDAIIKDISGGGVKVSCDLDMSTGDTVIVDFGKVFAGMSEIFGKVVQSYLKGNAKPEYGLEYISIKEKDRDSIIKYVFQRQIELRNMSR